MLDDRQGAYAEYVAAPARHLAAKPVVLSHLEAAGLPLAGLTAWQMLTETARLQPGQRVLIHAAGGGVGHLAVQIAKALGAEVLGTARADKHELLRSLGVDAPIDYTTTDFTAVTGEVDVVVNLVGGPCIRRSAQVLTHGGLLITVRSAGYEAELAAAAQRGGAHRPVPCPPGRRRAGAAGRAGRVGRAPSGGRRRPAAGPGWRRARPAGERPHHRQDRPRRRPPGHTRPG